MTYRAVGGSLGQGGDAPSASPARERMRARNALAEPLTGSAHCALQRVMMRLAGLPRNGALALNTHPRSWKSRYLSSTSYVLTPVTPCHPTQQRTAPIEGAWRERTFVTWSGLTSRCWWPQRTRRAAGSPLGVPIRWDRHSLGRPEVLRRSPELSGGRIQARAEKCSEIRENA
jgi:hypothetical protein